MSSSEDFLSRSYWNGSIKMGLAKVFILYVLRERSMHGYEVARAVGNVTRGCCSPTEGTTYPVLRAYEEAGCVTSEDVIVNGRRRRIYSITQKGRTAFKVAFEAWMEITNCLRDRDASSLDPATERCHANVR